MALHRNRPTVHREYLGFVRLWRDDLAEIVEVIAESSGKQPMEIQLDDEYTVDSIADLADYPGQRVELVTVAASGGRVRLVLGPAEASISVTEPNLTDRGMVGEVSRIAKKCRYRTILGRHLALSALKGGLDAATSFRFRFSSGSQLESGAVILTQTRKEAPPFWTRKRDDILIAVVSLIVGGVLGYVVNMIT